MDKAHTQPLTRLEVGDDLFYLSSSERKWDIAPSLADGSLITPIVIGAKQQPGKSRQTTPPLAVPCATMILRLIWSLVPTLKELASALLWTILS